MRVLLADDDADTRALYRCAFESRGYLVDEAENGQVVVALARSRRPDVVVLDNHMPVMSGIDAARALRADPACTAIPIIMLTGTRPRPRDAVLCELCVEKPCSAEDLLGYAHAVIRAPARA